jgi:hypothetical protein
VQVTAGNTVPTNVLDLRVWQANGGAVAATGAIGSNGVPLALQYLNGAGTEVWVDTTVWHRYVDGSGSLQWESTELAATRAAYVPTWTNLTVGNGTQTARQEQVGDTILADFALTFGTSTEITAAGVFVSLPVAPQGSVAGAILGTFVASSGSLHRMGSIIRSGSVGRLIFSDGSSLSASNPASPWEWESGAFISGKLSYEPA